MSQKEVVAIKPLSRFVEHFDTIPPTELLDMLGEEEQHMSTIEKTHGKTQKPTPLYALPGFNKRDSSNSVNSPEQSANILPTSPTSPTRKSYIDRRDSNTIATLGNAPMPPFVSQTSHSSFYSSHSNHTETSTKSTNGVSPTETKSSEVISNNHTENSSSIINSIAKNNNLSNIAQQQHKQNQQDQIFSSTSSSTRKKLGGKPSLNRAEIIIRRYESWSRFVTLLVSWINEIAKQSIQAEKAYQASLKESKFFSRKGDPNNNNGMHGFTADLALEEQKFGRQLQTEQVPILEKFKKECASIIKNLKSRPELNQEEFWRRAEITASLISQLTKSCKEATRTIEKGAPIVHDPWLVNLYVLRQLRGEVSEENRLRNLMVPIQKSMRDFEERLMKAVENTLKVCFSKPVALNDTQLGKIQSSLNQAITNNWDTFAAMNAKDIVNEENPTKHYLKINYPFKNDPLVMTVHKGQVERRTGVLNSKYIQRFFVITKSGFLHQFKLNDKVSPEFSIYLAKCTVVPCVDISDLNNFSQEHQEEKAPKDGFTFEIQRSGSVLQRDKSYVFRSTSFEDMATWCRHISEVATQTPEATLRPVFVSPVQSSNAVVSSTSIPSSIDPYHPLQQEPERPLSPVLAGIKQPLVPMHQPQLQESTPPPSPTQKNEDQDKIIEERRVSEDSTTSSSFQSLDEFVPAGRPKFYTAQLNI